MSSLILRPGEIPRDLAWDIAGPGGKLEGLPPSPRRQVLFCLGEQHEMDIFRRALGEIGYFLFLLLLLSWLFTSRRQLNWALGFLR